MSYTAMALSPEGQWVQEADLLCVEKILNFNVANESVQVNDHWIKREYFDGVIVRALVAGQY